MSADRSAAKYAAQNFPEWEVRDASLENPDQIQTWRMD
jgi:hypothetical protein